ncbi:hypothetical protein [Saccharopolyspora gregorii]|uniref:Uncharacterized protein n=1 Tax=Saccharopolyspora gregorii TaxID=33914 RepID=A0ABP6S3B5_9PSEU
MLNLDEVSNAENPLLGHEFTANERAKMTPAGSAGASDILRPALVHEFGGAYLDGDNALADVSSLFDVVLDGREGLRAPRRHRARDLQQLAVAAARHHPAMRAYLDTMIGKYEKPYADVVDGRLRNADPEAFDDSRVAMRRNSILERNRPRQLESSPRPLGHRELLDLPGLKNVMVQSTGT